MSRFGICEWYGEPFATMTASRREFLARIALTEEEPAPPCPFQANRPPCAKSGGVCSIRSYQQGPDGALGQAEDDPVTTCPRRFEQGHLPARWLGEIVGFEASDVRVATEVGFMQGTTTGRPAGKIDMVVARDTGDELSWYGLEVQAVYFSGPRMQSEFERLRDERGRSQFPNAIRRPDWRSSSAKRLMPQLQVKVPTLRRWRAKMAVVVDMPFFNATGGASANPSHDLGDGDIIWMVVGIEADDNDRYRLTRHHWEVETLEAASERLLAAQTIPQQEFLALLRRKLHPVE